jgi:hypothetical protein
MNEQRAWERRFSLYVLLGWLGAMLLFTALHLPAALRLGNALEITAEPAAVRTRGRHLGSPHPFEGWSGAADAADVLAEAGALPKAEPYEAAATRDKRRFALAIASRDAGKALSADDAGLFTRRPDLWLAFDAGRAERPVDPREASLWTRLLERRDAAVHAGNVFLAYLGLGAALLALAAWGARRPERKGVTP